MGKATAGAAVIGLLAACSGARNDSLDTAQREQDAAADATTSALDGAADSATEEEGGEPDAGDFDGSPSIADGGAGDASPPRIETHVNADSGDDSNAGTAAAPLKTLRRAFEVVGENGLVWLQPSTFNRTSEGLSAIDVYNGRTAPAGVVLRTTAPGVQFGLTVSFPAGGGVEELTLDLATMGRLLVSGGIFRAQALQVTRSQESGGVGMGLEISGAARVSLSPGSNPQHNYLGAGVGPALVTARDEAELTIEGGVLQAPPSTRGGNMVELAQAARLTMRGAVITNSPGAAFAGTAGVWMGGQGNKVLLEDTRIDFHNTGNAVCVVQDDNASARPAFAAELTIRNSVLTGCAGSAIQLREGAAVVRIESSQLTESGLRYGIEAGRIGFDGVSQPGQPRLTLIDTVISGNNLAGLGLNAGGVITIQGGGIERNGQPATGTSLANGYGGMALLGAFPYTLSMRNVRVVDNAHFGSSNGGLLLEGDANSVFDLGTRESPGANVLAGNSTPQLQLRTAAGVRVDAVGNTWQAAQSADAQGHYPVSGTLCANANPCDETDGSGPNFAFSNVGSSLRLAHE